MTDAHDPSSPEADARELVGLLRRDRAAAAPAEARGRVAARMASLAAMGGAGGGGARETPSNTSGLPARATGWLGGKALAVVIFAAGAGAGAAMHALLATPAVVYRDRVFPAAPAPSAAGNPPPDREVTLEPRREEAVAPEPTHPLPAVRASSSLSVPAVSPSGMPGAGPQLHAERVLLDEARLALARGDAAATLDILDRHARTFAHPKLSEEREALRVEALVKAGRYDEARAAAGTFRASFPDSMLEAAVLGALGTIP
jgi:hypothetical protein